MTKIVAVSGGADSMALLHFIKSRNPGERIVCAHFNHLWKSNKNKHLACDLVKEYCDKNEIEFFYGTPENCCDNSETKSRQERILFFAKASIKYKENRIYLAHHRSDNVETIFFRIIRGTGLVGLVGMQEESLMEYCDHELIFARPFINNCSKQDLYDYCEKNSIPFIEDPSNCDESKKRNFIRHSVFALLKKINPSFERSILRLAQTAKENQEFIDFQITQFEKQIELETGIYQISYMKNTFGFGPRIEEFWLKSKLKFANQKDFKRVLDFLRKEGEFSNRAIEAELHVSRFFYIIKINGNKFQIFEGN